MRDGYEHRFIARALAWPLASPAAFAARTVELKRENGRPERATAPLYDALEEELARSARGLSLDAIRALVSSAWFGNIGLDATIPLRRHVEELAREHLDLAGGVLVIRDADERDVDAAAMGLRGADRDVRVRRFRWLSLELPSDLIVAAWWSRARRPPITATVSLASPALAEELSRGVAETHLHAGTAVGFSTVWGNLMGELRGALPPLRATETWAPSPGEFNKVLVATAIVRLLLARFLRCPRATRLAEHLDDQERTLREDLGVFAAPIADARHVLLRRPGTHADAPVLRAAYSRLAPRCPRDAGSIDDPLDDGSSRLPAEMCFTYDALDYLRQRDDVGDPLFAQLFWQYVRARSAVFRSVTMEAGTGGLGWFSRYSRRTAALSGHARKNALQTALEHQSQGVALRSLELRLKPPSTAGELYDIAYRAALAAARFNERRAPLHRDTEVGLVLHVTKDATLRKHVTGDPRALHAGARYGAWYRKQETLVVTTEDALERTPELLLLLRGLDVAAEELAIPLWPVLPLLRRLRQAGMRAAERCATRKPEWNVEPLRLTFHAGEEYRRLTEGLRRIHELVEFRVLRPGDRIGHAVALGMHPARAAERAEVMPQPLEERLDDLLWEIDLYASGAIDARAQRLAKVEQEAELLASRLFGGALRGASLSDVRRARRLRHDCDRLLALGFPFPIGPEPTGLSEAERLMHAHVTSRDLFERSIELVEVRTDPDELELLERVQGKLRGELGRLEIVIESNPSSNWLIGDLLAIDDHPAFRLQPIPGREEAGHVPVLLTVNTDNPLTFATSIGDEFAHIYFALIRSGLSSQDALAWLARVRENGLRSRFTLRASAVPAELLRFIDRLPVSDRQKSYARRSVSEARRRL